MSDNRKTAPPVTGSRVVNAAARGYPAPFGNDPGARKGEQMGTLPHEPPHGASNEAKPAQLDIAGAEGDAYRQALHAMREDVPFSPGRKPSPDARPRGAEAPYAHA